MRKKDGKFSGIIYIHRLAKKNKKNWVLQSNVLTQTSALITEPYQGIMNFITMVIYIAMLMLNTCSVYLLNTQKREEFLMISAYSISDK